MLVDIMNNEELIKEASRQTGINETQKLINLALRDFVENNRRKRLMNMHGDGGLCMQYNYKKLRNDRDK